MTQSDPYYEGEKLKIRDLGTIAANRKLNLIRINLSEFLKSGTLFSCMALNLNYKNR